MFLRLFQHLRFLVHGRCIGIFIFITGAFWENSEKMQITLKKIRFKNLYSVGNTFMEYDLNVSPMTCIMGTNGAGKSTLICAICYALFNKPYRKTNKPQMPNSINQKELLVEIEFVSGKNECLVRRGMKPNVFEIFVNGILVDQKSAAIDYQQYFEEHILKMNFKTFTQIVVLGSTSFTPFMKLSPAERRTIIEDILDIEFFGMMNDELKTRTSSSKKSTTDTETEMRLCEEKISFYQKESEKWQAYINEDLSKKEKEIGEYKEKISFLKTKSSFLQQEKAAKETRKKALEDFLKIEESLTKDKIQLGYDLRNEKKNYDFYMTHENCPTCFHDFDEKTRKEKISVSEQKMKEYSSKIKDIEASLKKINENERKEHNECIAYISSHEKKIDATTMEMSNYNSIIKKLSEPRMRNDVSMYTKDIEDARSLLAVLKKKDKTNKLKTYYYGIMQGIFSDSGAKAKMIDNYIPVINENINKYLSTMDLNINFTLDAEFNEIIKSRNREAFSYSSFSEGEKKRIDIALLLTLRRLASIKNSININLLFLDEIFDSSLDEKGVEVVLKLLGTLKNTNLFVISHRNKLIEDKFDMKITVFKKGLFSQMKKV